MEKSLLRRRCLSSRRRGYDEIIGAPMSCRPPRRLPDVTPTVELAIRGPIRRADLPDLSARVCALFAANPGATVRCDVSGVGADAVTVDALARLQAVARRNGCVVVLRNAGDDLLGLVGLMGLTDVLPA
jgi:ABC-type transporter Mla MlaB component